MVLSWIFTGLIGIAVIAAGMQGTLGQLTSGALEGAAEGVRVVLSMTGAVCLWSGVSRVMEAAGVTEVLARCLRPLLGRIFPEIRRDPRLAGDLSANVCANLLGLGNAATPMGIRAARALRDPDSPERATDSLCRLVVLNTASLQLIPTTLAAVRSALGSSAPMEILPAVWITSLLSAGLGLTGAVLLGRLFQ